MNVIIPFHSGDFDQAKRLIEWIQFLGPQDGKFYLMTQQQNADPALLPAGWEWMIDYLNIKSEWSKGTVDASGPNAMWTQAAREMARRAQGPWLWLEPDAVPIRRDWLALLTAEYQRGGKPFMGGLAPKDGRMSGVAVYHQNTAKTCERAMRSGKIAFDYAGAGDFLRQGVHFTDLIADQFRCDPFKDGEDFDRRVPPATAIHHGDKGSIYKFARARLGMAREHEVTEAITKEAPSLKDSDFPIKLERQPNEDPVVPALDTELRPSEVADLLNRQERFDARCLNESVEDGLNRRLDWIMYHFGSTRRPVLYAALKKRGIECGRKSKPKKSRVAKAAA